AVAREVVWRGLVALPLILVRLLEHHAPDRSRRERLRRASPSDVDRAVHQPDLRLVRVVDAPGEVPTELGRLVEHRRDALGDLLAGRGLVRVDDQDRVAARVDPEADRRAPELAAADLRRLHEPDLLVL